MSFSACLSVCYTNYDKTTGPIATKLGTWTKFDLVVNKNYLVSPVVAGVQEGRSRKLLYVNVYHVARPGGGGRWYYKSAVDITCISTRYITPESGKPQS